MTKEDFPKEDGTTKEKERENRHMDASRGKETTIILKTKRETGR